jgi:hypothetical protein
MTRKETSFQSPISDRTGNRGYILANGEPCHGAWTQQMVSISESNCDQPKYGWSYGLPIAHGVNLLSRLTFDSHVSSDIQQCNYHAKSDKVKVGLHQLCTV